MYFTWAQNVTFLKKLCFGLNQSYFLVNFFICVRFGLQKVQTNAHFDSLKKWEWTHWKRRVVGCLCEYDRLRSHMCKCTRFPGRYVSSWLSSNFLTTRNEFSTIHARNFTTLSTIYGIFFFSISLFSNVRNKKVHFNKLLA